MYIVCNLLLIYLCYNNPYLFLIKINLLKRYKTDYYLLYNILLQITHIYNILKRLFRIKY